MVIRNLGQLTVHKIVSQFSKLNKFMNFHYDKINCRKKSRNCAKFCSKRRTRERKPGRVWSGPSCEGCQWGWRSKKTKEKKSDDERPEVKNLNLIRQRRSADRRCIEADLQLLSSCS